MEDLESRTLLEHDVICFAAKTQMDVIRINEGDWLKWM